jgi:glutamate/tyrosine decarboxylase-like PLP-dependent enzyme
MYRNYFKSELKADNKDICIVCSEDSHYSMNKASNLLDIDIFQFSLNIENRLGEKDSIEKTIKEAKSKGKKHFIFIANMMTTMFGSIDDIDTIVDVLEIESCSYKIHVDGAFGGFYYPFTNSENNLNLHNQKISSVTLDAHKMCQAPYGTGIFIARKGLIKYTATTASYVEGDDFTLIGSRSGANAIAVWMILSKYGPYKWIEKTFILQKRTQWVCDYLDELNIEYYRNKHSNIITIKQEYIAKEIAKKYGLVPDNHNKPTWFKIVVMDHVTIEKLDLLMQEIKKEIAIKM